MSERGNTARREREALNHHCPYNNCNAPPGFTCLSARDGKPTKTPHPERMKVASAALTAAKGASSK